MVRPISNLDDSSPSINHQPEATPGPGCDLRTQDAHQAHSHPAHAPGRGAHGGSEPPKGHFPMAQMPGCGSQASGTWGAVSGWTSPCGSASAPAAGSESLTASSQAYAPAAAWVLTHEGLGRQAKLSRRVIPLFQEPWDVRIRPLIGHQVRGQPLEAGGRTSMSNPPPSSRPCWRRSPSR